MGKFSVVISVYNKEGFIEKTLASVMNQTFEDFELVILNDGSTDNSEAEISKFTSDARVRYFSEENMGAGAGRNYVIKKAQNEYIALLDADDVWQPFYLEEQLRLIEKYPNDHVFATNSVLISNGRTFKKSYSVNTENKEDIKVNFFEGSCLHSIINSSSVVLHKDVFSKIGYYNPTIKSGQDTDLFIRVGVEYPVVFSPKICVQIMVLKNSLSKSTKKVHEKANFDAYTHLEGQNQALKKYLDLNRYSLCLLAKVEGNKEAFQNNYDKIDKNNLTKKQLFLLKQPGTMLEMLFRLKGFLGNLGLRFSVFK